MCANFQPPPLEKLLAWGFAIAEDAQYKAEVFPGQVAPVVTSSGREEEEEEELTSQNF